MMAILVNYLCTIKLGYKRESLYHQYTVRQKKGNPDLILNLRKTKRQITKLITGNDSTTISLSYDTLITHIG